MKKLFTILLAAMMLFSMVACTPKAEQAGTGTTAPAGDSAAAPAGDAAPAGSTEVAPTHVVRDDVNLVNTEVLVSLDIMQTNKTFTRSVLVQVYEGLTFDNEDGTWDYLLADDISVSADSLTYTIKLKQGVLFHNGEEMKAKDVAFSINRATTMPFLAAYTGSIESAEAADDYTVTMHMKAP